MHASKAIRWFAPFFISICVALAAPTDKKTQEVVHWNNPVVFKEAGLTHHSFQSEFMKTEVGYSIWLPPAYNESTAHYPVIYFLHGTGGTESADAPAFSSIVAGRVANGSIPAAICVFPNGGVSGYSDHPGTNIQVESMLIRELIPLIDRSYRTRSDRSSRVICGFSMGGGGSVRLALKYPQLFSAAASWAGAFAHRTDDGKFEPYFDSNLLKESENRVRILMIVGVNDLTYPWHAAAIEAFESSKYPFTLHTLGGVAHELGKYYTLTGDEFVRFLGAGFSTDAGATTPVSMKR
jgi:endo-1,4-beta-xylanase